MHRRLGMTRGMSHGLLFSAGCEYDPVSVLSCGLQGRPEACLTRLYVRPVLFFRAACMYSPLVF
jgi:hypothetical protein